MMHIHLIISYINYLQHKLSPQNLALANFTHFTQARGRPKIQPPMGQQTKIAFLGVGLPVKVYLWGDHPNPGPAGSTPAKGGICIENWEKAQKQKLLLGVGLPGKILFEGGSLQPVAHRVHSTNWGYMHWELGGGPQTKVAIWGGFNR
jgi:hypothetical protein